MSKRLNCGNHPGYSKVDKTLKDFCSPTCAQQWELMRIERGDSVGFGHHSLLPVYEIREKEALLTRALIGDKEAKRELMRRYRLIKKQQEVTL